MKTIAHIVILLLLTSLATAQHTTVILEEPGVEHAYPRLSKDGKRILYQSNKTGKWQLYLLDIATKTSRRLTNDTYNNNFPDWSPANDWIAFVSDRNGNEELYRMRTDGSQLERLTSNTERDIHPYFSPDGQYLLFNATRDGSSLDIYRMQLRTKKVERRTNTSRDETCARYAPDMQSIVFLGNDAVSDDIYILNLRNGTTDNLTKAPQQRDGWPMFSKDGKWIYYSSFENDAFHIFRIKPDGSKRQQISRAAAGEEDARVYVSNDGKTLVYNKRKNGTIAILSIQRW